MEVKSAEISRCAGCKEEEKIKVVLISPTPCSAVKEFQERQAWEKPEGEEDNDEMDMTQGQRLQKKQPFKTDR